jgi:hypothetical protein
MIFTKHDLMETTKALNPLLFFVEGVEPNFPVRVGINEGPLRREGGHLR